MVCPLLEHICYVVIILLLDIVPYGEAPTAEALDKWFLAGSTDVTGTAVRSSERYLQWWAGRIEASLDGNGFAVGSKLSLADVLLYNVFAEHLKPEERGELPPHRAEPFGSKERTDAFLAKYPKIKASVAAVANNANAQKWWATRGKQGF